MDVADYRVSAFDLKLALLQYFRFKRQWVAVDECDGADVIADTGHEIVEVEVKITKNDLVNGEKKKARKHQSYAVGGRYRYTQPNKFMFCVPLALVTNARAFAATLNPKYGLIAFDSDTFTRDLRSGPLPWHCAYIVITKSAKLLHSNYDSKYRWAISKRVVAKNASLMEAQFRTLVSTSSASGEL